MRDLQQILLAGTSRFGLAIMIQGVVMLTAVPALANADDSHSNSLSSSEPPSIHQEESGGRVLIAQSQAPSNQLAQNQAQGSANTAQEETETIVVTGSANPLGERKLTASFSITTADENQIREAAPSNTADLLKIVPGVFAETTGGTSGANIAVRGFPTGGDALFSTIELDGSPVYASPTLSFLDNSSLFRIDDTVARVEALRGGSSPIWSSGQPGVTVNFIQKNGEAGRAEVSDASATRIPNLLRQICLPLAEGDRDSHALRRGQV